MSLIDRAQQNISSLTENVVDLKNFCQIQPKGEGSGKCYLKI